MADDDKPASKKKKAEKEKKGLTGKHVALILGIFLILALAAVLIVYLLRPQPEVEVAAPPIPSGNFVVDEGNIEEIRSALQESIERGMFQTHMTTTWTFPDGNSPSSDAIMGNAASNNFPFWFTVTLSGTDQIIYTSTVLPLGTQLSQIKLDVPLPAGTYSAVIGLNMVDDDGIPVETNMGFGITIIVQN